MSQLDQEVTVTCPLAQAAARLRHFFKEHGNPDGDTSKLTLRIEVNIPGVPTPLTLQRAVIATIQLHHLPSDMEPRYQVQWAPEVPGPFPLFAGELVVESMDDYDSFRLRLKGAYTPPLGLVGQGFDNAMGNHVAQATAADLLHRIRDVIERDYQANEALKGYAVRDAPSNG
jgi:hypothetical protein